MTIVNLYALRSTDPVVLWAAAGIMDIEGPDNSLYLGLELELPHTELVVAAWGAQVRTPSARKVHAFDCAALTLNKIVRFKHKPMCLGKTKAGDPRHPLMLAYDTELEFV